MLLACTLVVFVLHALSSSHCNFFIIMLYIVGNTTFAIVALVVSQFVFCMVAVNCHYYVAFFCSPKNMWMQFITRDIAILFLCLF